MKLNGPWSFDKGQLRDKDGNALASFPIFPGGLGGEEDLQNGQLCALLPQFVDCLSTLVKRIEETPFDRNEGMKGPMIAEAKALLERARVSRDESIFFR